MIQKGGINFVTLYFKIRTSDKYDVNHKCYNCFLFITKWLPHKFKIYRLSSKCSKVKKYVNFEALKKYI